MRDLADRVTTAPAVRTLLAGAIDYAGLFPPAALSMQDAVRNYGEYLNGRNAWALGRFVVPIARLDEFAAAAAAYIERADAAWPLSLLAGPGGSDEWAAVERVTLRGVARDAIELRAQSPGDIRNAAARLPKRITAYYEIPIDDDPGDLIEAIGDVGAKAKVRTGGVTPDAFPRATDLARFIATCAGAGVPFKATAGLHHPLRAVYRLTYAPDSARGEMFGFLNVLLGAAFARTGLDADGVAELLDERDATALRFDAGGVTWRGHHVSLDGLRDAREILSLSFGSCSFAEPIIELQQLGLL